MREVPGAIVGAGTVVEEWQLAEAKKAGSQFIVSPGLTDHLALAVSKAGIPYLPGVSTAGDIMRGLDLGLNRFKFFPAEASGGIAALKALSAPFATPVSVPLAAFGPTMLQIGWRSTPSSASVEPGCTRDPMTNSRLLRIVRVRCAIS